MAAALALYAVWAVLLFVVQRSLVFAGTGRADGGRGGAGYGFERVPVAGGVEAWFLPAGGGGAAPVVVFGHGNGELIDDWFGDLRRYRAMGVSVLLVEYPGYGAAVGAPSEASIAAAFRAAVDAVARRPDVDGARLVVHGRSLGGGAVCTLLAGGDIAAVIVESTFTSLRSMSARYLLPGFLVRDPFDNAAALADFAGPVLVMHGERDEVIPFAHGEALAAAVKRATFVRRACGHNDCPRDEREYWPAIEGFLRQAGVARR
ncbi:MAG: alpha/beta hydrolase [Myxococcota bacterium]